GDEVLPRYVDAATKRPDDTHACDDHAPHYILRTPAACAAGVDRLSPAPSDAGSGSVLFEKLDRVADGQDRFRRIVGDFAAELFLEGHDQLDGIQAVRAQIVDEARLVVDLLGVDAQVLDDNLFRALRNVTHRFTLLRPLVDFIHAERGARLLLRCPIAVGLCPTRDCPS